MADKDQLIRDLASSFGMNDVHATKYGDSKYDASTGTLYCDGITIPRSTIDQAKQYFSTQMDYFKSRANQNADSMTQYLISTVAFNAICMLKDNIKDGEA